MNPNKKRGAIYLIIAIVCFAIMFLPNLGGAVGAFLVLASIICLIGGIVYLIKGFTQK